MLRAHSRALCACSCIVLKPANLPVLQAIKNVHAPDMRPCDHSSERQGLPPQHCPEHFLGESSKNDTKSFYLDNNENINMYNVTLKAETIS